MRASRKEKVYLEYGAQREREEIKVVGASQRPRRYIGRILKKWKTDKRKKTKISMD